jgi:peptide-methionine (S)-S-oxide reductase
MWRLILLTVGLLISSQVSMVRGQEMTDDQRQTKKPATERETATFGGGCFWCIEAVFEELRGVERVVSGYAGGTVKNPSYEQVCSGTTGHAEVVQIEFDPRVIQYEEILNVFFSVHDPTTLNRQGADVGSQYRSVILYHDQHQKEIAEKVIADIESSDNLGSPVVTELAPLQVFYEAEVYHQDYFERNPDAPYCRAVIGPKMLKFRNLFDDHLK